MVDSAFALIRPPGHHAHCEQVGGFCFFNNVGVAARTIQKEVPSMKKIVIFDWDIHYGDGTS
jgi:histone deacetylase 6